MSVIYKLMIDVLRPLLCTWLAKWGEPLPKEMKLSEAETPFRYTHAEIRIRALVICGPTRYQLDHVGARKCVEMPRIEPGTFHVNFVALSGIEPGTFHIYNKRFITGLKLLNLFEFPKR